MTIILAIWAAAAVAGTVTAVVMNHKKKPQAAICDTCEYLQIRNDHNDPKDGTTWFCSYGRGHRFTDPPEYCKMYHQRDEYEADLSAVRNMIHVERMKELANVPEEQRLLMYRGLVAVPQEELEKRNEYVWQV